jgi:ATP-dependent protease HslVU (ClpYQ) ATPase subunit
LPPASRERAQRAAEDRILDQLLPAAQEPADSEQVERRRRTREKLRAQLQAGGLEGHTIEVELAERAVPLHVLSTTGLDQMGPEFERFLETDHAAADPSATYFGARSPGDAHPAGN